MILWRLTRRPYADLSGRGGELADGRWHTRGRPIVYCAASAALAVLEVRVHLDLPLDLLPEDYVLMMIEAPDELQVQTVSADDLPDGWRSREDLCRPIGDAWLEAGSTALLSVPSAIVRAERNVLLNPEHTGAESVSVAEVTPFGWDERLFQ
jgi:RES domain-containing protein